MGLLLFAAHLLAYIERASPGAQKFRVEAIRSERRPHFASAAAEVGAGGWWCELRPSDESGFFSDRKSYLDSARRQCRVSPLHF
jgi:hypothetical protein